MTEPIIRFDVQILNESGGIIEQYQISRYDFNKILKKVQSKSSATHVPLICLVNGTRSNNRTEKELRTLEARMRNLIY